MSLTFSPRAKTGSPGALTMKRIPKSDYASRRQAVMACLPEGSILILPAAPVYLRNRDVEHDYRQDSDFYYLSGFPEPEALMVLVAGRPEGKFVLFCQSRDAEREIWEGRRAGQQGARQDYGADEAFPISSLDEVMPTLLKGRTCIYYGLGQHLALDQQLFGWLKQLRQDVRQGDLVPEQFCSPLPLLHDMRLRKSPAEVEVMAYAAEVSAQAHRAAMQASRPGLYEYHLEAELDYVFRQGGAKRLAYGSIVGSGDNACILHYRENDALLQDGDLVLIDAGCEIDGYASDITRTFPVSGRFSVEQKAIYQLVLEANEAALQQVAPGRPWGEPHQASVQVITEGLVQLGLLEGDPQRLIEQEAYRRFYMHRASHWLGMDVHDVGEYRVGNEERLLEPGMCLTIEPGIYIAPDANNVAPAWRGIGVRIEDDVVVTESGCRVLSSGAPKRIDEIEGLMAAAARSHP